MDKIPLLDWFETTLSAPYNGSVGTMFLTKVPDITLWEWETLIMIIEPTNSTNIQAVEIDSINLVAKSVNVSNVTLEKWKWVNYDTRPHNQGSKVVIASCYEHFKNLSLNKLDNTWFTTDAEGLNYSGRLDVQKLTYSGSIRLTDGYNINNLTDAGFYSVYNPANWPISNQIMFITVERHEWDAYWVHQLATIYDGANANQMWSRVRHSWTTWTSWEKLITGWVPKLSWLVDVRWNNKNPNQYNNQFTLEFSDWTTLWLSWVGGWQLISMNAWTDTTGQVYQNFISQEGHYWRKSTSDTTWNGWIRSDLWNNPPKSFFAQRNAAWASGTVTYTHNLGRVPKKISVDAFYSSWYYSTGSYTEWTGNTCIHLNTSSWVPNTTNSVALYTGGSQANVGVITNITASTFDIVWTKINSPTSINYELYFICE